MKKSIIYLGIAVLTFTNVISALAQQSFVKDGSLTETTSSNARFNGDTQNNHSTEGRNKKGGDSSTFDPESIVNTTYQKTMEEIIAENNLIIESTISPEENQIDIAVKGIPVCSEKTIEEIILQDSQIIESSVLNTFQPIIVAKSKK